MVDSVDRIIEYLLDLYGRERLNKNVHEIYHFYRKYQVHNGSLMDHFRTNCNTSKSNR